MAAIKADIMAGANPSFLMGSNPLFNGRKAPPHPATAPQNIGPKIGKLKSLAGIVEPAAAVSFTTTEALRHSYKKMMTACDIYKKKSDEKYKQAGITICLSQLTWKTADSFMTSRRMGMYW